MTPQTGVILGSNTQRNGIFNVEVHTGALERPLHSRGLQVICSRQLWGSPGRYTPKCPERGWAPGDVRKPLGVHGCS